MFGVIIIRDVRDYEILGHRSINTDEEDVREVAKKSINNISKKFKESKKYLCASIIFATDVEKPLDL